MLFYLNVDHYFLFFLSFPFFLFFSFLFFSFLFFSFLFLFFSFPFLLVTKTSIEEPALENSMSSVSALGQVMEFVVALCNSDEDGRVLVTRAANVSDLATNTKQAASPSLPFSKFQCGTLQYLMLNPAVHFSKILSEARAVILAGGTMQPFSHFTEQVIELNHYYYLFIIYLLFIYLFIRPLFIYFQCSFSLLNGEVTFKQNKTTTAETEESQSNN